MLYQIINEWCQLKWIALAASQVKKPNSYFKVESALIESLLFCSSCFRGKIKVYNPMDIYGDGK